MEKKYTTFRKTFLTILIFIILFSLSSIFKSTSTASDVSLIKDDRLTLMVENSKLKFEYETLKKRLEEIEYYIEKIDEYDKILYTQIIGIDYDTTNIYHYRNDSTHDVIEKNDSIFDDISDRSMYAAEILALRLRKLEKTSNFFKKNKNAINFYPNISPIKTKEFIKITSPYGWRKHPILNRMIFHEGIDISAIIGTPVHATAQGTIHDIMYSKYGYGNRIIIKHSYGFETLYAHLDEIKVKRGQWVNKNEIIGTVGNSGLSTGPHLHYEIRKKDETKDPLGYFYSYLTENLLANN